MGRETRLWKWLCEGRLPQGHFSRIESETSPGIPDVHYQVPILFNPHGIGRYIDNKSGQGWIELKADKTGREKYPFRGADDGLRQSQVIWMTEYLEASGTNLWICAALDDNVLFFSMHKVCLVEAFNEQPREALYHQARLHFPRRGGDTQQQAFAIRKLLT